jgi:hypothetical protein
VAKRIAVVGSREYPDMKAVRQFVWEQERDTVIVSGGARGVDDEAVKEARRLGMPYEVHLADWATFGRRAGIVRNKAIVDAADEVVAFWDGKSRGTQSTMNFARAAGKPLRVVRSEVLSALQRGRVTPRVTPGTPARMNVFLNLSATRGAKA